MVRFTQQGEMSTLGRPYSRILVAMVPRARYQIFYVSKMP
jgi:hypothetical protein